MPAASLARAWDTGIDLGVAAGVADVPPISPELVLVSPDLRARALALLPDRSPDGWIPPPYVPPSPVPLVLVPPVAIDEPHDEPGLVLSASLYALESVAHAAVMGGVLVTFTAVFAIVADLIHP